MAKIIISGFMGSGKTTVGKILSEKLNIPFYDLDYEIEKEEGRTINEIFKESGEAYFREIEKRLLIKFLRMLDDFVLSVGGGAVINNESLENILKYSIPILLYGNPKVFYERIKNENGRPLLNSYDGFLALYRKREKFYKRIPIKVNSEKSAYEVAKEILDILKEEVINKPQKILIKIGSSFSLKNMRFDFSIIDSKIHKIYSERFNIEDYYVVFYGERAKNLSTVAKIYNALSEAKIDRKSEILGLGGGVITDITGFVGSTYLRGINFSFAPTTLLSQVDSAIGGKNGVNLSYGKNLVGTISLPKGAYIDPLFIISLPKREILSGLGEVFKYAILSENGMFETLENALEIDFMTIQKLVYPSIVEKIKWIEDDLYDKENKRVFLNLGHTAGHMFEKVLGFGSVSHGEAVATGIIVSSYISCKNGLLKETDFQKILNLYKKIGFTAEKFEKILGIDDDTLINTLLMDKKRVKEGINIVVPVSYNRVTLLNNFPVRSLPQYIKETLKEVV